MKKKFLIAFLPTTINLLIAITGMNSFDSKCIVPVKFMDRVRILFTGRIVCSINVDVLPDVVQSIPIEVTIYDETDSNGNFWKPVNSNVIPMGKVMKG